MWLYMKTACALSPKMVEAKPYEFNLYNPPLMKDGYCSLLDTIEHSIEPSCSSFVNTTEMGEVLIGEASLKVPSFFLPPHAFTCSPGMLKGYIRTELPQERRLRRVSSDRCSILLSEPHLCQLSLSCWVCLDSLQGPEVDQTASRC